MKPRLRQIVTSILLSLPLLVFGQVQIEWRKIYLTDSEQHNLQDKTLFGNVFITGDLQKYPNVINSGFCFSVNTNGDSNSLYLADSSSFGLSSIFSSAPIDDNRLLLLGYGEDGLSVDHPMIILIVDSNLQVLQDFSSITDQRGLLPIRSHSFENKAYITAEGKPNILNLIKLSSPWNTLDTMYNVSIPCSPRIFGSGQIGNKIFYYGDATGCYGSVWSDPYFAVVDTNGNLLLDTLRTNTSFSGEISRAKVIDNHVIFGVWKYNTFEARNYLWCYDNNFNLKWKTLAVLNGRLKSIFPGPDSSFYVVYNYATTGLEKFKIQRIHLNGTILWDSTYSATDSNSVYSASIKYKSGVLGVLTIGFGVNANESHLYRISQEGKILWQYVIPNSQQGNKILVDESGSIYLISRSILQPGIEIIKLSETYTSTSPVDFSKPSLSVFPNPASEQIYIKGEFVNNLNYSLYATDGRHVRSGSISSDEYISVSELRSGMYFLTLEDGESIVEVHKVVVE